jgi:hypothetical protein
MIEKKTNYLNLNKELCFGVKKPVDSLKTLYSMCFILILNMQPIYTELCNKP